MRRALGLFAVLSSLVGCASVGGSESPLRNVSIPVRDPTPHPEDDGDDAREDPPESEPSKPFSLPSITRDRLPNGVGVETARVAGSPFVEARLTLTGAGSAVDGDKSGLSALAARLAWEGGAGRASPREMSDRLSATGATATWDVTRDALEIKLTVPKDRLADALDVLALALRDPRFDPPEFAKVKHRERAAAARALSRNETSIAQFLIARELFKLPTSLHPYASFRATAAEIDKLTLADVKAAWKQVSTPSSVDVLVVGDLDHTTTMAAIDRALSSWKGGSAPAISFTDPTPAEHPRILVADVPDAPLAEIVVGALSEGRDPDEWAALEILGELFAGGSASRVRAALHDLTPLASATSAEVLPFARGPLPWIARATVDPKNAGLAASAMLDELSKLAEGPPSDPDVVNARRSVAEMITRACGTARGTAELLARAASLGLPDDFLEKLPQHLRSVDAVDVQKAAKSLERAVSVVVIGDASKIAPLLVKLGDVTVLSAERNFEREKTLPKDDAAPLSLAPPKTP